MTSCSSPASNYQYCLTSRYAVATLALSHLLFNGLELPLDVSQVAVPFKGGTTAAAAAGRTQCLVAAEDQEEWCSEKSKDGGEEGEEEASNR